MNRQSTNDVESSPLSASFGTSLGYWWNKAQAWSTDRPPQQSKKVQPSGTGKKTSRLGGETKLGCSPAPFDNGVIKGRQGASRLVARCADLRDVSRLTRCPKIGLANTVQIRYPAPRCLSQWENNESQKRWFNSSAA